MCQNLPQFLLNMKKRGVGKVLDSHSQSPLKKAQVAVEFMVLMAFILIILMGIIALNQGMLDSFTGQFRGEKARLVVGDLADAAESVYLQGVGAQTRVLISVPSGVAFSQVSNNTLRMSMQDRTGHSSDIYRNTKFVVNGFIPTEEGDHWITVRAMPGYVLIGYGLIEVSPSGIAKMLAPSNSSIETIRLRNIAGEDVSVMIEIEMDQEIDVSLSQSSFSLSDNENDTTEITLSVPAETPPGFYFGELIFQANTSEESQTLFMPLSISVFAAECTDQCVYGCSQPIMLYPETWDLGEIYVGLSYPGMFFVCSNMDSSQDVTLNFSNSSQVGFDPSILEKNMTLSAQPHNCTVIYAYVNSNLENITHSTQLQVYLSTNLSDSSTIIFNASSSYFSMTIYLVPSNAWEEDNSPRWTTEVQHLNDGLYATALDEGSPYHADYPPPDYVEFNFSASNLTGEYGVEAAILRIRHYEDIEGGAFDEELRHQIDCLGSAGWQKIGTWQWTPENNQTWIYYVSPDLSSCISYVSPTETIHLRIDYDPGDDTGAIQYIDWAQLELNLTPLYHIFLWPMASDPLHPVTFDSGLNTTSNTFGRAAGDDGWDWGTNIYGGSLTAASLNVDPNMNSDISDSTVASDNRLKIILGGGTPGAPNDPSDAPVGPLASAAYGLQFNISAEMYSQLVSGGQANLLFSWVADQDGGRGDSLDSGDEAWIKARLITPSQTVWLGSNKDGSDDDADPYNEIWFANDPYDTSGDENIDITSYITSAGVYYLELGAAIADWDYSTEAFGAYFDDVSIIVK